jgi:regulator of protease activity HflC (stomatin/prohibitin superfamily)
VDWPLAWGVTAAGRPAGDISAGAAEAGSGTPPNLGVWIALTLIVLFAAVSSLRVVSGHERCVVSRFGRTARVAGPGLVVHLPVIERLTTISLQQQQIDLAMPAVTREGVPVHLRGVITCRIRDPARAAMAAEDPVLAAATEVENLLARHVARCEIVALLPHREQLEAQLRREATVITAGWGVRVERVDVTDIETRLTPHLLDKVQQTPKRGDA